MKIKPQLDSEEEPDDAKASEPRLMPAL